MTDTPNHTEKEEKVSQNSIVEEDEKEYWESLKKIRLQKKIPLEDLQRKTKINIRYFEAIEKGDFSAIPEAYGRLFLKTYAQELGLDFEEILTHTPSFIQQKPHTSLVTKSEEKPATPYKIKKRKKRNPLLLIVGILIIFSVIIIYEHNANQNQALNNFLTDTLSQEPLNINKDKNNILIPNEMKNLDFKDTIILSKPYVVEILPHENLIYLLQVENERSRENLIQKNVNHIITLDRTFRLKIFQPDKCQIMINKQRLPLSMNKPLIIQVDSTGELTLFGS